MAAYKLVLTFKSLSVGYISLKIEKYITISVHPSKFQMRTSLFVRPYLAEGTDDRSSFI